MWRILTMLVLSTPLLGGYAHAAESSDPGKTFYLRYCGACHGPGGKGDGIAGTFIRPKPTDLTEIAAKNGGEFPYLKVVEIIDGRNTVRAHGDPDMPVWGEVFQEQAGWDSTRQVEMRGKIMIITDHLRSIQKK